MANYEIYSFENSARVEVCRLMFAAACVSYTDRRVKPSQWNNLKHKKNLSMLPVLQIDGRTVIPQSMAIARYLAREFGFHGKTDLDMIKVDVFCDCLNDIHQDFLRLSSEKDSNKKAPLRDHYNDTCRRMLLYLEKTLRQQGNNTGFFLGEEMLLCDLMCFAALEGPIKDNPIMLKEYPKLKNIRHQVVCHPQISAYICKRPVRLK